MIFSQFSYALLLVLSVGIFFVVPKHVRRLVLIISGVIFYGYFAGSFLWLIVGELIIFYLFLRFRKYQQLLLNSIFVLAVLAFFKYGSYWGALYTQSSILITQLLKLPIGSLAAPLAISFFTFEYIHIAVEMHRKNISKIALSELAAYIFFFPSLVAGPIKRFPDFNHQIETAALSAQNLTYGCYRIIVGLLKKIVIADTLAALTGTTFLSISNVQQSSSLSLWMALLSFTFQIYFDFSGYSDIAIGSARLFGITLPENFNLPYLKTNIAAFWRSWHMSLTGWIIDYIYIPLGGSRVGTLSILANTLVALVASGIWHGQESHFLLWGFYHGVLLCGYRLLKPWWDQRPIQQFFSPIVTLGSVLITFFWVMIGWLFFIAPLDVVFVALSKMMGVKL